jgi:hypothetical protein
MHNEGIEHKNIKKSNYNQDFKSPAVPFAISGYNYLREI